MSARDKIMSHLLYGLDMQPSISALEAKSAAEKLVDDLLHEEAEKIRNTLSYAYGCRQAADLIDPYIKEG